MSQHDHVWSAFARVGLDIASDDVGTALAGLRDDYVADLARALDVQGMTVAAQRAGLATLATERKALAGRVADGTASVDEYRSWMYGR